MNRSTAGLDPFARRCIAAGALLMLLGVEPGMLVVIMAFEVTWGTFIHAGERSFRTGRFGPARYFIITPSYHRVHHGRNPLYMDTNFCSLLPFWDWMFGTLYLFTLLGLLVKLVEDLTYVFVDPRIDFESRET